MFSKACEYALRAALYISVKSVNGSRLGIPEIARQIDAPVAFTAKILQNLSREGIISSIKGPNGGFFIDPKSKPVSLATIVKAIDGSDDVLHTCSLGLKECSDKYPCPIHDEVKVYKTRLRQVIKETTMQSLVDELANGKTFLKSGKIKKSTR
jgi:Rrf2 family transcriptional regulator, iron-sulfur cluster assembly transcription factor